MNIYKSPAGAEAVRQRYLDILDHWPVPAERVTVPTGDGDTFVLVSGPTDAPAVIALQGSGATTAMWRHQISTLSQGLRVHAVDLIGEPGLSAPARPPFTGDAHARWLDDVLDGLGLSAAAFVGVSLGGWIATDYAIRRPDRVSRLALLSPSGLGRRKLGILASSILLSPFGEWGRRRTMARALGVADLSGLGEVGEFALLVFAHFRPRMNSIPTFGDDALRGLSMPVLAVVGGRDTMLDSAATARRLTANVPHATVTVLPDAGHVLPDQSAELVAFLGGGDRPA